MTSLACALYASHVEGCVQRTILHALGDDPSCAQQKLERAPRMARWRQINVQRTILRALGDDEKSVPAYDPSCAGVRWRMK